MTCPHCQSEVVDDARFCGACGKAASATESIAGQASAYLGSDPFAAMIGKDIAGRYRVIKKLGEGGMGAVFRAEQISLKRACAVKLLRPGLAANQQMLRRFNAEAEAVAKLSHPNTVNIYDFGQDTDGTLFIAMEYVEGSSLRDVLQKEAPLPIGRALAIASQIASSLTDAHAQSIVHRDLKPDNVMLSERGKQRDVVRVLDFGIAKLRDDSRQGVNAMTQAGDMLGTPQYMAPEQIKGEAIDGRVDVYALGCLLFEMITGRMCFEAPTIMAMLSKHLVDEVEAPSKRRPDLNIPPAVDALVLAALAKEPSARPSTMELYGEQILTIFQTLPPDQRKSANVSGALSTPMSAVMGIPGMTPTPAPGFAPPTPPPMGAAPTGIGTAPTGFGAPTGLVGPPPGVVPTAAVGPPPGLPTGTPAPAENPYAFAGAPPHAPVAVATSMPPQHITPQMPVSPEVKKGNLGMWIMLGVVVLILVIVGAAMHSVKDDNFFGIDTDKIEQQMERDRENGLDDFQTDEERQRREEEAQKRIEDLIDRIGKDPANP